MTNKQQTVYELIESILQTNSKQYGAITVLTGMDYKHFPTISYKQGLITGGRCKNFGFMDKPVANYSADTFSGTARQDVYIFLE